MRSHRHEVRSHLTELARGPRVTGRGVEQRQLVGLITRRSEVRILSPQPSRLYLEPRARPPGVLPCPASRSAPDIRLNDQIRVEHAWQFGRFDRIRWWSRVLKLNLMSEPHIRGPATRGVGASTQWPTNAPLADRQRVSGGPIQMVQGATVDPGTCSGHAHSGTDFPSTDRRPASSGVVRPPHAHLTKSSPNPGQPGSRPPGSGRTLSLWRDP